MTSFEQDNDSNFFKKWKKINEKSPFQNFIVQSSMSATAPSANSKFKSNDSHLNNRQDLPYSSFLASSKGKSDPSSPTEESPSSPGEGNGCSSNSTNGNPNFNKESYHYKKIEQIINAENVDLIALRKESWNGIPSEFRCMVWQFLLGYLPTNKSRREQTIIRKRKEYFDTIPTYFGSQEEDERTTQESEILRQILVDLPRTCPNIPFFQQDSIQKAMERILYIWSIRHPASGYVQGMNDLLTPILLVFMNNYVLDALQCDLNLIDHTVIMNVEADSYWCLTKLLDNIQDHYTFSQPGLQRMVCRLEDLTRRIDNELHEHFQLQTIEYMQFAFRWMNCLLLREVPLPAILRLWDTYLSEERKGFDNFHVYVCAVLLKIFSETLQTMQFQEILLFLQDLPTSTWGEEEMESILAQAYILSHLFEESPNHLA
jgi:TBC1 domain family member 2